MVFTWPAIGQNYWRSVPPVPKLFTSSAGARAIGVHDVALVLSVGLYGQSMLWQAEAHLRFAMASGYAVASVAPDPYKRFAVYRTLASYHTVHHERRAAVAFLHATHATVVVLDDTDARARRGPRSSRRSAGVRP